MNISWSTGTALLTVSLACQAAPRINVDVDRPTHAIPSTLWGLFFEDINLSADGGLYPELVRNRSFEDADTPSFWSVSGGEATIDESLPLNSLNRKSLRLRVDGEATLVNEGYWGMNVVAGDRYRLDFAARSAGFSGSLEVKLVGAGGAELASGEVSGFAGGWDRHALELTASGGDPKAKLQVTVTGTGTLFLDMVSLMPMKTWKDHGLRIDLAESMAALNPAFFRFPGGCWVEGDTIDTMYDWKATIGDVDSRTPLWNLWEYHATNGLGYHEYLQLAEDLGAEPVFCINAGMAHFETVPMGRMGEWVQDALDALEYANGPADSLWGGRRAEAGHPEPFDVKYLEIGNESGGEAYEERWPLFYKAVKAKYPEVQLIANKWKGEVPDEPKPDIVDEHYYDTPEWFMSQAGHFDDYDRDGPRIYVGEYAATRNCGKGNLRAALGEAAFMTGIERNSDVVTMACYAPLFVNVNHRRWNPNLINFDSSGWYGTPGYYVQKLFAGNPGSVSLATEVESGEVPVPMPSGRIGVGTWNTRAEFKDVKVTAPDGRVLFESDFGGGSEGWEFVGDGEWSVVDGAFRQTRETRAVRAIAGDRTWTDYTLELKARKLAGDEGFLVLFHVRSDQDRGGWNLGGWSNTLNRVEIGAASGEVDAFIETGRWYDIKVQLDGWNVKCWLDGELVHDVTNTLTTTRNVYAHATRDGDTGEVILKVVNVASVPIPVEIDLAGAPLAAGSGTATVLTHEDPQAENSLAEPLNVAPRTEAVAVPGPVFTHEFPAHSFTVLRIPTGEAVAKRY